MLDKTKLESLIVKDENENTQRDESHTYPPDLSYLSEMLDHHCSPIVFRIDEQCITVRGIPEDFKLEFNGVVVGEFVYGTLYVRDSELLEQAVLLLKKASE